MEQTLGLMAFAGALPGHVAREARRRGWRVVALAFDDVGDLEARAHRVIPCRITAIAGVLEALQAERVTAVVFSGSFSKETLFQTDAVDAPGRQILASAGGLSDPSMGAAGVALLSALGIRILDQRTFLGSVLAPGGLLTARGPSEAEWRDVGTGLRLARQCAEYFVGQTVVVARGVAVAVEALEGTSEAIRRGCRLAGPGTVVVKAIGSQQDYRFDVPAVGLETLEIMAQGRARVLAVEAGKVAILDREAVAALADGAGITIVGVESGP